jgi:Tfp pilus assembly protein PilF
MSAVSRLLQTRVLCNAAEVLERLKGETGYEDKSLLKGTRIAIVLVDADAADNNRYHSKGVFT